MTFRPTPPSKTKRLHSLLGELGEAKTAYDQIKALFLLFALLKDIEKNMNRYRVPVKRAGRPKK